MRERGSIGISRRSFTVAGLSAGAALGRRILPRRRMPRNSQANTHTESSEAASGTIFLKKPHRLLPSSRRCRRLLGGIRDQ
jgi:hypothetical protein